MKRQRLRPTRLMKKLPPYAVWIALRTFLLPTKKLVVSSSSQVPPGVVKRRFLGVRRGMEGVACVYVLKMPVGTVA